MEENEKRDMVAETKRHWVGLTRACNNRCLFCLDSDRQDNTMLPLEAITNDLQQGRELGIKRVILSGGEPSLHPQFLEIVSRAKKMGYDHIQVITNGRMFVYNDFLNESVTRGVKEITFSFHGHTATLHDCLTQVKGSFQQAIKGLVNALKMKELIISIDIVINKLNVKYLADIINFFINIGVYEFDLLQVVPFGRAWENKDKLFYPLAKSVNYLEKALKLSENSQLHIWTNRFPAQYLEGFEHLIQHPVKLYDEVRGRKDTFDAYLRRGVIMPCHGDRCQYCYLQQFCADLIALQKDGALEAHPMPQCLSNHAIGDASFNFCQPKITSRDICADITPFLAFYISHRYFIKSLRCKRCFVYRDCSGMQCDYIRKQGFKVLKPIQKAKREGGSLKKDLSMLEENIPYTLLRLTKRCNTQCLFCNIPVESDSQFVELSTRKVKDQIDNLCLSQKKCRLDISGGEPTLRQDLPEIIAYAVKKGIDIIQIQTNGIALADKQYVRKLSDSGLSRAFVALHSSSAAAHDYLVGKKGAFNHCIAAIHNLLEHKINVTLNPVITTRNYKGVSQYLLFVRKHFPKIQSISLSVIQPRGRAWKNSYLVPQYTVIDPYIRRALLLSKDIGLVVNNPYCGLPLCIGDWYKYVEQSVEYCEYILKINIGLGDNKQNNFDKIKGQQCQECTMGNFCNGVWREYAQLHSFNALKPIK